MRAQYYRFKNGHFKELFPFGTYKMPVQYGAQVEGNPGPDAMLTAPEPTLDEVKAQLKKEEQSRRAGAEQASQPSEQENKRSCLINDVNLAFTAEANEVAEANQVDVGEPSTDEPGRSAKRKKKKAANGDDEPHLVVRRHRFQKLNLREGVKPARIVVHRDARRGRPKKGSSDPPG